MIQTIAPAGTYDGQVIHAVPQVRQPVGNPQTALPMLLPFAPVRQQWSIDFTHCCNDRSETFRQPLPRKLTQLWLVIECIEMTWPAFHKQENHAPRFCSEVPRPGSEWVDGVFRRRCQEPLPLQKIGQRQRAEARSRPRKKITSRIQRFMVRKDGLHI